MNNKHTTPLPLTGGAGGGSAIGLFGGSFNPIHNAHVTLARTICDKMGLDEVWFLVSPQNPLKKADDLLDENSRLEMARLALEDEPKLIASDYEFHLERPSYTWKTLKNLKQDFPNNTFYIIIGADNWACFDRWAHSEEILRNYHIIVYPREGYPFGGQMAKGSLPTGEGGGRGSVTFVNTPLINITSTMLRQMLKEGKDISQYVSPKVLEYIKEHKLYIDEL